MAGTWAGTEPGHFRDKTGTNGTPGINETGQTGHDLRSVPDVPVSALVPVLCPFFGHEKARTGRAGVAWRLARWSDERGQQEGQG